MSGPPPTTTATTAGKPRKKAATACTSCRVRRTKCSIEPGQEVCKFCHQNDLQCLFQNDDERKISSSKAHISALNERVHMLENLLRQQQRRSHSTPATELQAQAHEATLTSGSGNAPATNLILCPPDCPSDGDHEPAPCGQTSIANGGPPNNRAALSPHEGSSGGRLSDSSHPSLSSPDHRKPVVHQLVVTVDSVDRRGNSGHPSDRLTAEASTPYESRGQRRQIDRLLEEVSPTTDDYLLSLFFEHGNSMLPVVHEEAFYRDKAAGRTRWYNGFLHICILAIGLRYADRSKPDVMRLMLPNKERMAIRLCFDIGLNFLPTEDLAPWEMKSWRRALWACYLHDKYWSFYLARPTSMKRTDIVPIPMKGKVEDVKVTITAKLIALMEIITTIVDNVEEATKPADDVAYLYVSGIYRKLKNWYAGLPEGLKWAQVNIQAAPLSFFLLHQQYYSSLILLYRPFTLLDASPSSENDRVMAQISSVPRAICLESAIEVARIFREYRPRFDMKLVYFSAVQHAATAATALISGLNHIGDPGPSRHVHDLSAAERMSTVLDHIFNKAGWTVSSDPPEMVSTTTAPPARSPSRGWPAPSASGAVQEDSSSAKRPRASKTLSAPDWAGNSQHGFSQFLDPGLTHMNMPQSNPYYDSHAQNNNPGQMESEFQPNFLADFGDTDWNMILGPPTVVPRRAGFLDLGNGFDQTFQ
ncbi:hypothetical protein LTR93_011190 [Exophiala xenobiotica]|nr:hypothetical protein LTR93_011190 [Exophiala xenobiotica]